MATEAQIQVALEGIDARPDQLCHRPAHQHSHECRSDPGSGQRSDRGQGSHAELLETSEIYAEIYSSQLVDDTELEEIPDL
jgi:hypothetical protein